MFNTDKFFVDIYGQAQLDLFLESFDRCLHWAISEAKASHKSAINFIYSNPNADFMILYNRFILDDVEVFVSRKDRDDAYNVYCINDVNFYGGLGCHLDNNKLIWSTSSRLNKIQQDAFAKSLMMNYHYETSKF